MTSQHLSPSVCPFCGAVLDVATNLDVNLEGESARPVAGDTSVCINCAHILVFDDDLALRKLADGELDLMFAKDAETARQLLRLSEAIRFLILSVD